jgi:hypothetical protein
MITPLSYSISMMIASVILFVDYPAYVRSPSKTADAYSEWIKIIKQLIKNFAKKKRID